MSKKLRFRNYQPVSSGLIEKSAAVPLPAPILEEAKEAPKPKPFETAERKQKKEVKQQNDAIKRELDAHVKEQGDGGDLMNIAPRKANFDLKRDLSVKMEKLSKRTKYAIVELIKRRIEADGEWIYWI